MLAASTGLHVLSLPALFALGIASSTHCALMCGVLQAQAGSARAMQIGRVLAYTALGALAGGAGHWMLRLAGALPQAEVVRALALPVLLGLLLWQARRRTSRASCCARPRTRGRSTVRALLSGAALGLTPCALLYAAAGYAALTGSAWHGGTLMLAFGLGTVPAVQFGAWGWRRWARASWPAWAPASGRASVFAAPNARGLLRVLVVVAAGAVAASAALDAHELGAWCLGALR